MPRTGVVITAFNEGRAGWRERPARKCPNCGFEAFENRWPEDWLCPKCSEPWHLSYDPKTKKATNDGRVEWQYEDELSEKYEGNEVLATLDSVRANSDSVDIVVVDDGSDDGCCAGAKEFGAKLVRHQERIGIGYSRTEGVEQLDAMCDTVMFLDAHMRISTDCVEHSAKLALDHDAVVWPDVRGLRDRPRRKKLRRGQKQETATQHGASARTKPDKDESGYLFRNRLIFDKPVDNLSRTHALNSPGYTLPMSVWNLMPISKLTRGFGGNEPMIWVKAFFLDIPILHTCDAMVRHMFRAHTAHYTTTPLEVNRNMAILAKTCFDAETWNNWWSPEVFDGNLDQAALEVLESDELMDEHYSFQCRKRRTDSEFWRGLCLESIPERRNGLMAKKETAASKRAHRLAKHGELKAKGRLVTQADTRADKLATRAELIAEGKLARLERHAELKAAGRCAT